MWHYQVAVPSPDDCTHVHNYPRVRCWHATMHHVLFLNFKPVASEVGGFWIECKCRAADLLYFSAVLLSAAVLFVLALPLVSGRIAATDGLLEKQQRIRDSPLPLPFSARRSFTATAATPRDGRRAVESSREEFHLLGKEQGAGTENGQTLPSAAPEQKEEEVYHDDDDDESTSQEALDEALGDDDEAIPDADASDAKESDSAAPMIEPALNTAPAAAPSLPAFPPQRAPGTVTTYIDSKPTSPAPAAAHPAAPATVAPTPRTTAAAPYSAAENADVGASDAIRKPLGRASPCNGLQGQHQAPLQLQAVNFPSHSARLQHA